MNRDEFLKGMVYLGTIYGKEFTKDELTVWYSFFHQVDSNIFKVAIKNLAEKNRFIPSIAEIRAEINKIQNPELKLNAEDEWTYVLNAIHKFGYYNTNGALESLKPITREIVERLGFQNLCMSENINWERKVFIETFNSYKKNQEFALIENKNERILIEEGTNG